MGYLPFVKKKNLKFPKLPNARWIKYLNVGKELIKVAQGNIGKYLNNLKNTKCVFKKRTQSQKP